MTKWSKQIEEEITILLKDWLKSQGRTQADLKRSLQADSSRLPSLLDALKKDFSKEGLIGVASRLCIIEKAWSGKENTYIKDEVHNPEVPSDPCDQLDLLLEEIREDCDNQDQNQVLKQQ